MQRIEWTIDENEKLHGVKVLSIVSEPAIESNFVFLNKQKPKFVELKGEYKGIVAGLALIPNKDIYRKNAMGEDYTAFFSIDTIEKIRTKFHKEQLANRVNTQHNPNNFIEAFLIESFIVDSEQRLADVKAKGIDEVVLGSWFVAYKIEDKEVFQKVVSNELNGFSVEAFLENNLLNEQENNLNKEVIKEVMSELKTEQKTFFQDLKSEIKAMLAEIANEAKVEDVKQLEKGSADGKVYEYTVEGEKVNVIEEGKEPVPAPDGDFTLDNGKVISVASGVLVSVKDAEPVEQKKEEPAPVVEEKKEEQLSIVVSEKEVALEKEVVALKAQIEELQKQPLAQPTVVALKKKKEVDFSKMSNLEIIAYKNGIEIEPSILKALGK